MKKQLSRIQASWAGVLAATILSGCSTLGPEVADIGLAGAGGVVGYQVSDGNIGGAAAGAVAGYVASKAAQAEIKKAGAEAEKRGFDRAMNQAVKQQYWIIQAQQRAVDPGARQPKEISVLIPEMTINGVVHNATIVHVPDVP